MRHVVVPCAFVALAGACSSSSSSGVSVGDSGADAAPTHEGGGGDAAGPSDAGGDAAPTPKIPHLVVIVQENHTFDNYFARWCTATPGSSPTCTQGPSCCEAGPTKDPGSAATPITLDDAQNAARDPDHHQDCEQSEIDNGKMDAFATAACGATQNIAYADQATVGAYWTLAQQGALADHYFQPTIGQSSSNDMYFARARFVFKDNTYEPQGSVGAACTLGSGTIIQYTDTTIADLLEQAGVTWAFYSEGYDAMKAGQADGGCPGTGPSDCTSGGGTFNCGYDPGDNPFAFYKSQVDTPAHFKDLGDLATDLSGGTLPAVSFVKAVEYKTEHPGYQNTISAGVAFVQKTLQAIQGSSYPASTLVLLTYDEGGGYFDHVPPPPTSAVDNQPYGTRVPTIAIGPFARAGTISHVVMEHSSIVKFIESNWLGKTGQLGTRDATVANIGSLLDPSLGVPEN
jgi:phospholipase C